MAGSGIYSITHLASGRRYIGQSGNVQKRLGQHLVDLRSDRHHCSYLQNAFRRYGEEAFTTSVVEICDRHALTEREQFWMDNFRATGLYNTAPAAGTSLGVKRSAGARAKMAEARRGQAHSPETRAKMRESQALAAEVKRQKAIENWNKPGFRAAISKARKGRSISDQAKAKIGASSKAMWADEAHRAKVSRRLREFQSSLTPEQRSENARKSWEVRRANRG